MTEQITVVGNIATNPQRRQTGSGDTIINFRLASTKRRFVDATNSWEDVHTNWYDVSAYRRLAEHALASLQQGQRVIVTGTLKVNQWESGEKRGRSIEIDASAIGPDLLWGTTTFTKTRHEVQTPSGVEDGPRDATLDDAPDAPDAPADARDLELVGASVGGDEWAAPGAGAADDDGTPY